MTLPMSRPSSATPECRLRVRDQISLQAERLSVTRARTRSPSATATSRRWSSIVARDTILERPTPPRLPSVPPAPAPSPHTARAPRPASSAYTAALIKHSHKLRDRSLSPAANSVAALPTHRPEVYRSNQDYYRGKVRSVYEKEPMFREFVRNISLSEMNFYEHRNLSVLKQRFNTMVQARHGMDAATKYDPYTPSARLHGNYEPKSSQLSRKHSCHPRPPASPALPRLYIYHRKTGL